MGRRLRHKRPPQWVLRWNRRKKNLATDKERLIKQIGEHDSSMDYMFLKEQSNGELHNILYRIRRDSNGES